MYSVLRQFGEGVLAEAAVLATLSGANKSMSDALLYPLMINEYDNVTIAQVVNELLYGDDGSHVQLDKRGIYAWIGGRVSTSSLHATTRAAAAGLFGAVGAISSAWVDYGVRSLCSSYNGQQACLSWSEISTSIEKDVALDAINEMAGYVGGAAVSVQEYSALLGWKRSSCDACLSDRATGCT